MTALLGCPTMPPPSSGHDAAMLPVLCPLLERPPGYDRVRNAEIGNKDFELDVLEEAYTTEHWLVRIYKVSPQTEPKAPRSGKKTTLHFI